MAPPTVLTHRAPPRMRTRRTHILLHLATTLQALDIPTSP